MFNNKVWHSASTIFPCWQYQCNRTWWNLNKSWLFWQNWFWSLCSQIQNVRLFSSTDGIVSCSIDLIAWSTIKIFDCVLLCFCWDISCFPFTKFWFIMECESMEWCVVSFLFFQLYCYWISCCCSNDDLRCLWWC